LGWTISPVNDELIIEARVSPNEITHVKERQNVPVRLTALIANQRMAGATPILCALDLMKEFR
jgi:hypothetical protein